MEPTATVMNRSGVIFDIMPTVKGQHYIHQRDYHGLFLWGATSNYSKDTAEWLIKERIWHLVSGTLPDD
jgi:hypothetical protein